METTFSEVVDHYGIRDIKSFLESKGWLRFDLRYVIRVVNLNHDGVYEISDVVRLYTEVDSKFAERVIVPFVESECEHRDMTPKQLVASIEEWKKTRGY